MISRFFLSLAWWMNRLFPRRLRVSDLETIHPDDIVAFGKLSVLPAFRKAAKGLPFYRKILAESGVSASRIRTLEDFSRDIPIIRKENVFQRFDMRSLCENGYLDDVRGTISTSGTSGAFAYALLTRKEMISQQKATDALFGYYFDSGKSRVFIINALAMGVTFHSEYPMASVSVRPDIAVHFVKMLGPYYDRILILCDPNFAKRILDEGKSSGIRWEDTPVSFIVGGAWAPNSLIRYIFSRITGKENRLGNTVSLTMGLTEIGLNIFNAPPELITLRDILQNDPELLSETFGDGTTVCPEIMYHYPTRTYVEIADADSFGNGRVVISNLDMHSKSALFRYDTGDRGVFLDRDTLIERLKVKGHPFSFPLGLPLIAIYDRENGARTDGISVPQVKEALFLDTDIAPFFTGHFKIFSDRPGVDIQLEKEIGKDDRIRLSLEASMERVSGKKASVNLVAYQDFQFDMSLDYERKWKHSR